MTILVTGANGFVGRRVCSTLRSAGFRVRAGVRDAAGWKQLLRVRSAVDEIVQIGDIGNETFNPEPIDGCHCVVHLAARVHVMNDSASDPLREFRRVNLEGTSRLAEYAATAGVKRFLFMSTIKVNGDETYGEPFNETSAIRPNDPYAISKSEAEDALRRLASTSKMELTILRPPLVYGPGVRGNLRRLIRALNRGIPIIVPPGENRRSMAAVDNLASLVLQCVRHPKAANEAFVMSDRRDFSTRELIEFLALGLERQCRIWPIPPTAARWCRRIALFRKYLQRLGGSLQADASKAGALLGWTPTVAPEAALVSLARSFRMRKTDDVAF